ncbi:MBL fold metallo-hydrolase [Anaerosporobacter faecicola]|uniref:MBL fold metallo-hydrolase n=1 Tax=Anaerosporobacter faecicola TaxID=2718714 RepID=UPI00143C267D|nr:MBL fold metallo-hydrolase [Anaerosporobacter faecicola]
MKITALVENQAKDDCKAKHGLSLYIETQKHKILFDLGPDSTLFTNAAKKNIDLTKVDTVIISHGHMDHGGALKKFLAINNHAKIYVQRRAFEAHSSKFLWIYANVGIDKAFLHHPQIVLLDGDQVIDEELQVFVVTEDRMCYSNANDSLYENRQKDHFLHEQNLVINEKVTAMFVGCGHTGIVNIMKKGIQYAPQVCIGGYHLYNPLTKKTVETKLLDEIASHLKQYDTVDFYTCHCTGKVAYTYLASKLTHMHYLSCGETITLS